MIDPRCILFAVLSGVLVLTGSFSLAGDEPPKGSPSGKEAIRIEFPERKIQESERSPEGELKVLLASRAVLKTERPIRYRRTVLPAGAYPVTISKEEGGQDLCFDIGPEEKSPSGGEGPGSKETPRERKPGKNEEKSGGGPRAEDPRPGPDSPAKKEPARIRAIFRVTRSKTPTDRLEFSVRPTAKGDRFSLQVSAGSSRGRSTLRFADQDPMKDQMK